jgi:CheY-like chemotaxis protein
VALKVLVVEDDAPTLELMDEVLTSLKADVHAVSDSEAALALVNQERFDGIFLDLQMPKMDGFELTRRIRKSSWNKSAPIVVVTGEDDVKTMERAFAAGTTFFLQKPVDRQRLTNLFKAAAARCSKIAANLYEFRSRRPSPVASMTKLSREQVPISARGEFSSKWAVPYL